MNTDKQTKTASAPETRTQPGTADIDAVLERQKQYTRKLHGEVQQIIEKRTSPAEKPTALPGKTKRNPDWHPCAMGGIAPTHPEDVLAAQAAQLAEALRKLRHSIRHAHNCKSPQAFPCSCDADTLWDMSAEVLAAYEGAK